MSRRKFKKNLPAPYLERINWANPGEARPKDYSFALPFLKDPDWSMGFTTPVAIIVGENSAGESILVEAIADLAGYDVAGAARGKSEHRQTSNKGFHP